jgi:cytochrome oxidase assembly protein ShyY1
VRRLWVRWVLLVVFVAALGTAFVNLGEWQLDRLHQRRERNTATVGNEDRPVQPWTQVFTRQITDADQWQRVSATGTFDAEHQYVVRYRSSGDTDGYEVVTPLRTADGTVLVDRGIVPVSTGTQIPSVAPAPPTGQVTVVGHVRRDEEGKASARTPVNGSMRLIDSQAIATTLPYPVVDGYIGLLTVDPPQTGGFQAVALPEISDGPHFWYAVQWFMFTGIGVLGVVVFIRGDLRERRTGSRKPAAGSDPGEPGPTKPELTSTGA